MFFFNDTATPEIYTLSLHDALPILALSELTAMAVLRKSSPSVVATSRVTTSRTRGARWAPTAVRRREAGAPSDRKSTRLNSSHANISYAVFCLIKKQTPHYSPFTAG